MQLQKKTTLSITIQLPTKHVKLYKLAILSHSYNKGTLIEQFVCLIDLSNKRVVQQP